MKQRCTHRGERARREASPNRARRVGWASLLLAVALACGEADAPEQRSAEEWEAWSASEAEWQSMLAVEELLRALEPSLAKLGRAAQNLELPGPDAAFLFRPEIGASDLLPEPASDPQRLDAGSGSREVWHGSGEVASLPSAELSLWQPMLEGIDYLERAAFRFDKADFTSEAEEELRASVIFSAGGRDRAGRVVSIESRQEVVFTEGPGKETVDRWRIRSWKQGDLSVLRRPDVMFREVLDTALQDPAERTRARQNLHEELLRRWLRDPAEEPVPEHFTASAMDRHPGLAVVDFDADGYDDIYVMARWGRNQLFRNRGDGSFEEVAARVGLDVDGHTSSAVFADLDNDGDPDAFLGRTLRRSQLFENRDGRFVPWPVEAELPYFASSVNAVDVDGDGLLDLYVSTYAARISNSQRSPEIMARHLAPADAEEFARRRGAPQNDRTLHLVGPPNTLLLNDGAGGFRTHSAPDLRVFMNSYQSAWADYDDDGDPDVYVANDFGPNLLLRNDGGLVFSDVTGPTATADVGFGMGASFGDYDGDGRQDLYVSNMYSKAGRRITRRFEKLDPRYAKMARGNTLFRNVGESFEHVSGLEAPALLVEKAGWSWGGQFIDYDNDTDLDLVALSGYYSAPPEYAIPVDT